jgi:hypothetical protein
MDWHWIWHVTEEGSCQVETRDVWVMRRQILICSPVRVNSAPGLGSGSGNVRRNDGHGCWRGSPCCLQQSGKIAAQL